MEHDVHLRVFDFLPDVGAKDFDFGLGISKMAGEEGISEAFETFHDLEVIPGAHFFLLVG